MEKQKADQQGSGRHGCLYQVFDRHSQRLVGGSAIQTLCALVPIQDPMIDAAHDNGVPRLVEQRGLVTDARIRDQALLFGCRPELRYPRFESRIMASPGSVPYRTPTFPGSRRLMIKAS
jgi:hypothetical protein